MSFFQYFSIFPYISRYFDPTQKDIIQRQAISARSVCELLPGAATKRVALCRAQPLGSDGYMASHNCVFRFWNWPGLDVLFKFDVFFVEQLRFF